MASKLNPGADATLVSAAYRAGMATAPADYSDAFENVARGYEKTMQAQSKLWKNIADIGAVVGADLMQTANEFMDYRIAGAALNPDSAQFLVAELDAIKQAQKDLGLFGGILGNSETRQKKRELKIKQAELFAEIDMAAASINAGAEAVAGGLYDSNLDSEATEMVTAIIKSNLKDKVTIAGNTAVLSRDEKTGELMFTLMRDGKPATGSDGKPKTMTIKEFNKTISMNVDDKGAMQGLLNQLNDNEAKAGNQSSNGVYDPERKQMALNQLDAAFKTPTDIRRGMLTKFGYSNTSFAEDVRNPSVFSAEIYGSLLRATGGGEELALGGITEGIEDTDNSGGISQDEIANNYIRFAANILSAKDPEASKAFLKEYTVKKLEDAYKYGYGEKPKSGGDWKSLGFRNIDEYMKSDYYKKNVLKQNIEETGFVPIKRPKEKTIFVGGSGNYMDEVEWENLNSDLSLAANKQNIPYKDGEIEWDDVNGTYMYGDQNIPNKRSLFEALYEDKTFTKNFWNSDAFKNITDWKSSSSYEMPKNEQAQITKLWDNAISGATRSSEKYAVAQLNNIFGGGFTEEKAGNKWTVGYAGRTFHLKTESDKDDLINEIIKQKMLELQG
mgnify:CR=1 FL=1